MNEPGNKATMILDTVKFGSKSNAGKGEVKLTFSSRDDAQLNQFLIEQAGNPVDLVFLKVQGSLELVTRSASNGAHATTTDGPSAVTPTKDEPDAEITEMIVNGEPAKVRRPRKSSNGNGATITVHAFKENEETPGLCGVCHHRFEDEAHDIKQPHAFRQPLGLDLNSETYEEDAKHCEVCGLEVWDGSNVHGAGIAGAVVEEVKDFDDGNAIDEMAQNLIDSIETPAEAVGAAEGA